MQFPLIDPPKDYIKISPVIIPKLKTLQKALLQRISNKYDENDFVHTHNKVKCVTKEESKLRSADQLIEEQKEDDERAKVSRAKAVLAKEKRAKRANWLREQRAVKKKVDHDKYIADKEKECLNTMRILSGYALIEDTSSRAINDQINMLLSIVEPNSPDQTDCESYEVIFF